MLVVVHVQQFFFPEGKKILGLRLKHVQLVQVLAVNSVILKGTIGHGDGYSKVY